LIPIVNGGQQKIGSLDLLTELLTFFTSFFKPATENVASFQEPWQERTHMATLFFATFSFQHAGFPKGCHTILFLSG